MPIKVTSRFATVRETVQVLGVSKRRTDQLIEMAEEWLARRAPVNHGRTLRVARSKRKASHGSAGHSSTSGSKNRYQNIQSETLV